MKALITYPVGLLLKAYMLYAAVLIKRKERRAEKEATTKQPKWQTA